MDFEGVTEPGNARLASQALALFHTGKWAQALPVLRQVHKDLDEAAEISAALGICRVFSAGPLEPGDGIVLWENLETAADLLRQGESTGWPEVSACQEWLQLLQERQSSPEKIPAALDLLKGACQQSRWFPIWSLAFRALAYYDRRQTIRDLLAQAVESPANGPCGLGLVLAEAQLECAQITSAAAPLLQDIDIQNCLPLAPEVAHLWHQWLLAEFAWWKEREPDRLKRVQTTIANLLEAPVPENDPYSLCEWNRLTHHAALLGARCALSQHALEKAQQWIRLASRNRPRSWEGQYLSGLVAWSLGDHQSAQAHLEESLAENPFQSRVRFELGMLLPSEDSSDGGSYLEALPGVHDALASSAAVLFRLGRETEARQHLEQLDQVEAPYSLRLIWPQARALRLRQGKELRAHLAETSQDWLKALGCWDTARQIDLPSREVPRREAPGQVRDLVHRAHRLYLLGRHLRQQSAVGEGDLDRTLQTQFQKELGKLSIRPLMGEAMFYRGLAAEENIPDRAIADWRALLRQTAWVEKTQKMAPSRLLYLGDRLLRVGLIKDAHKAYDRASAVSVVGAQERVLASELITHHSLEATYLLQTLEAANAFAPDDAFWLFLCSLCLLAKEPPDCETAQPLLEQACQAGLPARLEQLSALLLAVAAAEPDAGQQLCSFLDEKTLAALPPTLQLGLEVLCRPKGLENLLRFKEAFGADWMAWCPISPEEILGRQLRNYCAQSDDAAALGQIQETERLGLYIPDEWKAFLHASQAVRMALRGDFGAAEVSQQQALESLSPNQREVDENEDDI